MKLKIYLALLVLLFSSIAQSQIGFKYLSVHDGLSNSSINDILYDSEGFVWFATMDGLNKFDGYKFQVYKPNGNKEGYIASERCYKMIESDDHTLIIGTRKGISTFNRSTDSFNNIDIPLIGQESNELTITDLFLHEQTLYILTEIGIIQIEKFLQEDQTIQKLNFDRENHFENILYYQDELIASSESGLYRLDIGQSEIKLISDKPYNALYIDSKDQLLAATSRGLDVFKNLSEIDTTLILNTSITNLNITDIEEDDFGYYWLAGNLAWKICGKEVEEFQHSNYSNTLSGNSVNSIEITNEHTVFIGTKSAGISYYNPNMNIFRRYKIFLPGRQVLTSSDIKSIYVTQNADLLIGTANGFNYFSNSEEKNYHYLNESEYLKVGEQSNVNAIIHFTEDNYLLGTGTGLYEFNLSSRALSKSKLVSKNYSIRTLQFDSSRNLLIIGTQQNGVLIMNTKTKKSLQLSTESQSFRLSSNSILSLYYEDSLLWVGTDKGLNKLNLRDTSSTLYDERIKGDLINCITRIDNGALFVGTSGEGINIIKPSGEISYLSEIDGLANNVVYGILEDNNQRIWVSTNNGLSMYLDTEGKFYNFGRSDDVNSEFNTGAFYLHNDSEAYFGGIQGMVHFNINEITPNDGNIRTYIDRLSILNQNGEVIESKPFNQDTLLLSYQYNSIKLDLSAIDYLSPIEKIFHYKLMENNKKIFESSTDDELLLRDLNPGEYSLSIFNENNHGFLEEEGISFTIIVEKPFWMSWWFRFSIISIIPLGIWIILFYRERLLKQQNVELESIINQRTSELKLKTEELFSIKDNLEVQVSQRTEELEKINKQLLDQNSSLEQFSFIIAHNLKAPIARAEGLLNLLRMPTQSDESKTKYEGYLHSSVQELNFIVNDLGDILSMKQNSNELYERINPGEIMSEVIDLLKEFAQLKNVKIDFKDNFNSTILGIHAYYNSIFQNLIHNAIKYSKDRGDSRIDAIIEKANNNLVITVQDNGIGIDMKYARDKIFQLYQRFNTLKEGKGLGLYLVKSQVEIMEGTIFVKSEAGIGTEFVINFPVK